MTARRLRSSAKQGWIVAMMMVSGIFSGTLLAAGNGDSEKGKTIFQEKCQHCHGSTGQGDGDMASYLDPPPSNLASATTQNKSDGELQSIILEGRKGTAMAGFEGALEELQLNDLLVYLRSLKP